MLQDGGLLLNYRQYGGYLCKASGLYLVVAAQRTNYKPTVYKIFDSGVEFAVLENDSGTAGVKLPSYSRLSALKIT